MKKLSKKLLYCFFVVLVLGCKEDETFDLYSYNGEYPKNMDGSQIKTYIPKVNGGTIDVDFNGHSWNHTPYLSLYATEFNPPTTVSNEKEIEINIYAQLTNQFPYACGLETAYFRIPLKTGKVFLKEYAQSFQHEYYIVNFSSANCDATKDRYELDKEKSSWINITSYNNTTREMVAEFDVNFKMNDRNSDFGPVYPEQVNLKGKITTVTKL